MDHSSLGVHLEPFVADVRMPARIDSVFSTFRPHVVFHAAAYKQIPLMEKHPCEAVINNVYATRSLLDISSKHKVRQFVFISSDKAVNPTSVMGCTKRVGELLVQAYAEKGWLPSTCVRFGNVMSSRGSIVALFERQIAEGGPVTVTHPDVVRFFMSIPEAVHLVICAGALGSKGEIFVLEMGSQRNILELANDMVRLAGLRPGKDVDIVFTGLRPGEKLREELVADGEETRPTAIDGLLVIAPEPVEWAALEKQVLNLVSSAWRNDVLALHPILEHMPIGFRWQAAEVGMSTMNGVQR